MKGPDSLFCHLTFKAPPEQLICFIIPKVSSIFAAPSNSLYSEKFCTTTDKVESTCHTATAASRGTRPVELGGNSPPFFEVDCAARSWLLQATGFCPKGQRILFRTCSKNRDRGSDVEQSIERPTSPYFATVFEGTDPSDLLSTVVPVAALEAVLGDICISEGPRVHANRDGWGIPWVRWSARRTKHVIQSIDISLTLCHQSVEHTLGGISYIWDGSVEKLPTAALGIGPQSLPNYIHKVRQWSWWYSVRQPGGRFDSRTSPWKLPTSDVHAADSASTEAAM